MHDLVADAELVHDLVAGAAVAQHASDRAELPAVGAAGRRPQRSWWSRSTPPDQAEFAAVAFLTGGRGDRAEFAAVA